MTTKNRFRGCLAGLAAGDAVGTTVEFMPRSGFEPLRDMVGGGPFNLGPGQWTDDTSMTLCLAESLVEKSGFDARDQMERYCRWMETGYLSSTGSCFDIGSTVATALQRYLKTGEPYSGSTHPRSAGNGSIMRLAPIPMNYYPDINLSESMAGESSRTTHGAEECIDACRLLARMTVRALSGRSKEEILLADRDSFSGSQKIVAIARAGYLEKDESDLYGTGYVVQSLEAALWCFAGSVSFRDAVLRAANLGDDADTTAAVCGQLAGAYYGLDGIPRHWTEKLAMKEKILELSDRLYSKKTLGE
ncbi:ADP-ribosylglycohydrolase family protein [Desulfonatronospira sp.]|uniref:ADP-ribosylglycohydrolase family protein n=1 Tax=Desulfonatronospira sp. TaxID=1962951 RepID=UPI0025B8251E|nr:ADP-ribosylglycohydrolase family protein [Desulfonatronospira sp.]